MSWMDFVNGWFEGLAGLFQLSNCWRIYSDKQVRGVNKSVTAFFTLWGCWNLFFYPNLGQWFSFYGGMSIVLANCLWIFLALKYRKN